MYHGADPWGRFSVYSAEPGTYRQQGLFSDGLQEIDLQTIRGTAERHAMLIKHRNPIYIEELKKNGAADIFAENNGSTGIKFNLIVLVVILASVSLSVFTIFYKRVI